MKIIKYSFINILFLLSFLPLKAQNRWQKTSLHLKDVPFSTLIESVEDKIDVKIFYHPAWYDSALFSMDIDSLSIESFTEALESGFGIQAYIKEPGLVFITREVEIIKSSVLGQPSVNEIRQKANVTNGYIATSRLPQDRIFFIGKRENHETPGRSRVNGRIISEINDEALVGATLFFPELRVGYVSDYDGFFSFDLFPGKYLAEISCIGFESKSVTFQVISSGSVTIKMSEEFQKIDEVTIFGSKNNPLTDMKSGFEQFSIKQTRTMPVLLGESDIIKSLQTIPGVKSTGEGSSGLYVRGGNMDQNNVYYNHIPIFNTSHLAGFISSFNSNSISDFSLYKGSIPAEYGGRLSSVISVDAKKGSMEKFGMKAGINPLSTNIVIETPIIKDKLSLIVGLRSSYSNYLLNSISSPVINNSTAGFNDLTMLLSYQANEKNSVDLFIYNAKDNLKLASFTQYDYSTKGISVDWQRKINSRLSSQLIATSSIYNFNEINTEIPSTAYEQDFYIQHPEIKYTFTWNIDARHKLKFGLNEKLYLLNRGSLSPYGDFSGRDQIPRGKEKGLESVIFLSDEFILTSWLQLYGGVRYSAFQNFGPDVVYQYNPNLPREALNITDSVSFGNWETTASYFGPEIRLAANIRTGSNSSFKLAYNQTRQYLFMLSNTVAVAPVDQWKLVDPYLQPLVGRQYSLGFYKTFPALKLFASSEIYYKQTDNLPEFKDGVNLLESNNTERDVLQGEQEAYGLEISLKSYNRYFDVIIAYNYSRSIIEISSLESWNQVNNGIPYPSNYDQPHMLNMYGVFKISKRLNFAGNLVYSTGRPVTFPTSLYYLGGTQYIQYSARNEYRLPDYFRIDLSLNIDGNLLSRKPAHSSWSVGVYNATGRMNAYSLYFRAEEGVVKGYKLSIIGAPIFTLTWQLKLGNYNSD